MSMVSIFVLVLGVFGCWLLIRALNAIAAAIQENTRTLRAFAEANYRRTRALEHFAGLPPLSGEDMQEFRQGFEH